MDFNLFKSLNLQREDGGYILAVRFELNERLAFTAGLPADACAPETWRYFCGTAVLVSL